jgi:hypothetical protein
MIHIVPAQLRGLQQIVDSKGLSITQFWGSLIVTVDDGKVFTVRLDGRVEEGDTIRQTREVVTD